MVRVPDKVRTQGWRPRPLADKPASPSPSLDAVAFAREKLLFVPDPIHEAILRSQSRRIILCMGRPCGKTYVTSAKAIHFALTRPGSDILVFSATNRQANIVLGVVRDFARRLGIKPRGDGLNPFSLLFPNGSRLLSLPPKAGNIVGFTPHLVIMDEASRIPDGVYDAISPMLGLNDPVIILLMTPRGRRGVFYQNWTSSEPWDRHCAPTTACPPSLVYQL